MRFRLHGAVLATVALLCAQPSRADNYTVKDTSGTTQTMRSRLISGIQYPVHLLYGMFGSTPTAVTTDSSGNLNVNVVSGGGGGGGTTTKANASAPTLTEGSTANQLSVDLSSNLRVKDQAVLAALGSPFQSGASIGNSSFGISGTLPGFASPPTFNLGTLNGAALASTQSSQLTQETALNTILGLTSDTAATAGGVGTLSAKLRLATTQLNAINSTLGSPFQAGASIGNSSFGISGTLPGFASPPTFNCGTGCGSPSPFVAAGQAVLNVTTSSARVALPTADPVVVLTNNGTVDLFFKFGSSSVTAASTDIFLGAARSIVLSPNGQGFIAAISGSSTSSLQVTTGTGGAPPITGAAGSGGGGGGGAATVADGADVTQGAIADAAATAGGTGTLSAKLRLATTQLNTINSTLGSPFQAGASIGNASFGISGTLPAFASPPTFNLGTLNGAATATGQATGNASVGNIDTNTGAKADSAATDSTSSWSVISLLKGAYNRLAAIATSDSTIATNTGTIATNTASASAPSVAADSSGNVKLIQAAISGPISASSSGWTQLLALSSGKKIYVTEYDFQAAGTVNVKLGYGTGTNCGTGTTDLTGAYNLTAQNGVVVGSGVGPVRIVPSGNALCINLSASQGVAGGFAASQF